MQEQVPVVDWCLSDTHVNPALHSLVKYTLPLGAHAALQHASLVSFFLKLISVSSDMFILLYHFPN